MAAIDQHAFGVDRTRVLYPLIRNAATAIVYPASDRPTAWGLLRHGSAAQYLGPLMSSDLEGAVAIATRLINSTGSAGIFWDIQDENAPAIQLARRAGFQPLRPLTRMELGSARPRTDSSKIFAIADPALG